MGPSALPRSPPLASPQGSPAAHSHITPPPNSESPTSGLLFPLPAPSSFFPLTGFDCPQYSPAQPGPAATGAEDHQQREAGPSSTSRARHSHLGWCLKRSKTSPSSSDAAASVGHAHSRHRPPMRGRGRDSQQVCWGGRRGAPLLPLSSPLLQRKNRLGFWRDACVFPACAGCFYCPDCKEVKF